MSDKEDDDVQDALTKLETAIRVQIEKGLIKNDIMVSTQRSRFYKAWCYIIWGHLIGTNNICLRCGKRVTGIASIKTKL